MTASRTPLPSLELCRRAARCAALLLLAGCYGELERFSAYENRVRANGYEIVVRSPRYNGRYPESQPIPIRVEIRNTSDAPQVLDLASDPPRGQCSYGYGMRLPPQREAVELFFSGRAGRAGGDLENYLWQGRAKESFPPRLVLQPGESRVLIDTTYTQPKELADLSGHFCARVWRWEVDTAIGPRQKRR